MTQQEIIRLRALPVEGVAERLGMSVSRHKSLCPFHADRHPSLTFNPRRNTFRCFVCGASGNPIDLVMRSLSLSFADACQWLARGTSIILTQWHEQLQKDPLPQPKPFQPERYQHHFVHPLLSPEAQQFLFSERRLNSRVIEWCRLNSWTDRHGTHWLEIPYFDQEGNLIGVQNRNLTTKAPKAPSNSPQAPSSSPKGERPDQRANHSPLQSGVVRAVREVRVVQEVREVRAVQEVQAVRAVQEVQETNHSPLQRGGAGGGALPPLGGPRGARFLFASGSRTSIYNLPVLPMLRRGEPLYITEGCSDCWAMLSSGRKAVAIPSATLLTPDDVTLLQQLAIDKGTRFHMYPDRDAPGENLFRQLSARLPSIERHQLPPDCKDYADFFVKRVRSEERGVRSEE